MLHTSLLLGAPSRATSCAFACGLRPLPTVPTKRHRLSNLPCLQPAHLSPLSATNHLDTPRPYITTLRMILIQWHLVHTHSFVPMKYLVAQIPYVHLSFVHFLSG
ncbi:hypothetical protein KP509_31G024000 [Ceratopteris richardii]|uniref:Uncharacterized protein n=1 Tax=Ceratopteris richardii TaxID=49495 RepID=A0A8T2QY56_CERRI|nr:hypothetical protein KP509_31G024000 [Ceratopteris richardii]